MPVQIANPDVVSKIDRLSRALGVGKTAAVEAAVDRMLVETNGASANADPWDGIDAIVSQMHRVPMRPDAFDAVVYDDAGLPR